MASRNLARSSSILILICLSLISCKAEDVASLIDESGDGSGTQPIGVSPSDGDEPFPFRLGNLSDYFDLSELVISKGFSESPEDYVQKLNSENHPPQYQDIREGLEYIHNKIEVSQSGSDIFVSYGKSQIYRDNDGIFKVDNSAGGSCSFGIALSQSEIENLSLLADDFKYCERTLEDLTSGVIILPDGATMRAESSGFHDLSVFDLAGEKQHADMVGIYLGSYAHKYVCGDRRNYMDFLKAKVNEQLAVEGCPVLSRQWDPLEDVGFGWQNQKKRECTVICGN